MNSEYALAKKEIDDVKVFTFGVPESFEKSRLLELIDCGIHTINEYRYYSPPVSFDEIVNLLKIGIYHSSALTLKKNLILKAFKPNENLKAKVFERFLWDFLIFGNAYFEIHDFKKQHIKIRAPLAKYVRRLENLKDYIYMKNYNESTLFKRGSIFHLMENDVNQEIYGLPNYLSVANSVFLNDAATVFRRRFYENGSHAGFIMYMTDPIQNENDIEAMRSALRNSRGIGNFKNIFLYVPNGKKDGIQIIPISELGAKDDFFNIKNLSRDDQLAAHRVPPQLLGIIPQNAGGFGDATKAVEMFLNNEILPIQAKLKSVNEIVGLPLIDFVEIPPPTPSA